ncbi:HAD hydrolase family protein [Streptomyces netropsis]|uniref:HAD hydrolase family protein n=1 Tax=Streptomyces netropsis TaxID=55404 RepID=UPI0037B20E59
MSAAEGGVADSGPGRARGDRNVAPGATEAQVSAMPSDVAESVAVPGPDRDVMPGAVPDAAARTAADQGAGEAPTGGATGRGESSFAVGSPLPGRARSVPASGPGDGRSAQAAVVRVPAPAGAEAARASGAADRSVPHDPSGVVARPTTHAPTGGATGVNHDKSHRPRRQDRPQDLLETGAAYAMRADGFRSARHRFFGRTELVRTDTARVLEIDDPHDLARARALAPLLDVPGPGALPTRDDVDAVVLDFDGTQTDDRVLIDSDGRELVAVHRGDGLGVAALRRAGLALLILSTEVNPVVAARGRKLRVPVLHGIDRKDLALKQWCEEHAVAPERVLYVGNDVNDLPCFDLVGWPVAVADAHDVVRGAARAVTSAPGGSGAVREIASWLLGPSL